MTVAFYPKHYDDLILYSWQPATAYNKFLFIDGSDFPVTFPVEPPAGVRNNLSMVFEPGFFAGTDPDGQIFINMPFGMVTPLPFLNNTATMPFDYNYSRPVNQPFQKDAIMEVAIW